MSNYTQGTFFTPKDALSPGDPLKTVKGADVDPEFSAISTAIATKVDTATAQGGITKTGTSLALDYTNLTVAAALDSANDKLALYDLSATAMRYESIANIVASYTGHVPTSRQVIAGVGITGGGALTADVTLTADRSSTTPTTAVGYLDIPQNAQTGSYTLVIGDRGKHLYHALGDGAATYTIPANSSVAFPVGTSITFTNLSATTISIAITTDTMRLAGAGTTGTRSLGQYGVATAIKLTSTIWIINGSALT